MRSMTKKTSQSVTELKHFIRANSSASDREIIVEQVKTGSASFHFLKKMEDRRKEQECVRMIDMRGRVPYECKSYVHKNQVFWMDDISYKIFLKGLKENNNVFTNQIFESIVQGEHTNSQSNKKNKQADKKTIRNTGIMEERQFNGSDEKFLIEGDDAEIFHLGYYQQRIADRLKHSTEILISTTTQSLPAKTRDISSSGLKIFFQKPAKINVDDEISITFTGFNNTSDSRLFDIKYKVLSIDYKEPEFILRVIYCDESDQASTFITSFIEDQKQYIKGRKKLDIEDTRLTSESLLTELYYTNATPSIPFFIRTNGGQMELQTVCVNSINKTLLQCFKNDKNIFEFTNLSEKSRIEKLINITQDNGQKDPVLAVYSDQSGKPKIVFDYDFPDINQWYSFVKDKLNTASIKLFKAIVRTVSKPDERKVATKIDKLKEKAENSVIDLLNFTNYIVKAGVLIDVTSEMNQNLKSYSYEDEDYNKALAIASQLTALKGNDVDILQFGYTEQRREDRYHVSVDTEVLLGGKKYTGSSRDISIKGLCIELEAVNTSGYKKDDIVDVAFPVLHKRANERINLNQIPYTITCVQMEAGKPLLHLKREKTKDWKSQTDFFKDLIGRNIKLIKLDTEDIETSAKSRIIASIAVENTATLPIFVQKGQKIGDSKTAIIAMPRQPSAFNDFFEVQAGQYNFKSITHPNRLSLLTNNTRNNNVSELLIYLYKKQIAGTAQYEIFSAIESDFESVEDKLYFFDQCKENDYRVIKVAVSNVLTPDNIEIASAIEKLQDLAPHYAQRLQANFDRITAIGDIVDVTNQVIIQ